MLPDVIDNAKTAEEITQLFQEKYKEIYTSVPTNDEELNLINENINNLIRASNENEYCYISPDVVRLCITRLKPAKTDGDTGLAIVQESQKTSAFRYFSSYSFYFIT